MQSQDVVIITGASAGIGRELARQLAPKGVKLGLTARREELLAEVADEAKRLGASDVAIAACDAADRDGQVAAISALAKKLGPVDVLIANAGIGYPVPVRSFDAARAARIYQVNLFGVLNAIEAVLPSMISRRKGHIVGISSLASYRSFPESHAYCGSKSAVSAQLEGLRLELKPLGIDVSTICPGFIVTDMTSGNNFHMPFLMQLTPAVNRIVRAIERRQRVMNFPRRFYWLIKLSRLIPESLIAKFVTPPTGKSYKG